MATIVNNPSGAEREVVHREDSGAGWAVALVILVLLVLFLLFGLPNIGGNSAGTGDTNVIPDEVDVNVNPGGALDGGTE